MGSFFLSDAKRGWQGRVVAEPDAGLYLVELFKWLSGSSSEQVLVRVEDMMTWSFFDDADWMRSQYEHGTKFGWERDTRKGRSVVIPETSPDLDLLTDLLTLKRGSMCLRLVSGGLRALRQCPRAL